MTRPTTLTRQGLRTVIAEAATALTDAGVPSPERDAEALAAHALGLPHFVWYEMPSTGEVLDQARTEAFYGAFDAHVARRRERYPLQRILGHTAFREITVTVGEDVFVPRPETEVVAQVAIDEAARVRAEGRTPVIVDLCCGSGIIGISVDVEVRGSRVYAADLSPAAVLLTRHNAGAVGSLTQVVVEGDVADPALFADLDGTVDVVVSNPPYIPPGAVPIDPEVRDHDPELALYGLGDDGLEVPRAVIAAAARLLAPGGLLVMEHAEVQAAQVRAEVEATGAFVDVTTRVDLTGRDRMVVARRVAAPATEALDVEHSPS